MTSLLWRPKALGLIGALALIVMVSVPVHGQYERGPVGYRYDNVNCTGVPANVQQIISNETLDLGLGACVDTSEMGSSTSERWTCANGELRRTEYYDSASCGGPGYWTGYATNRCFPGELLKKRDLKSTNTLDKLVASLSSKRLPGDTATYFLCNAGEPWTLVENTAVDLTAPALASTDPEPCPAPGACPAGSAHASAYNSTGHPEPVCDEPVQSATFVGGGVVGQCYFYISTNVRPACTSTSAYFDYLPYGCAGTWFVRQGMDLPYTHDQCDRIDGQDASFFCPSSVPQPTPPSSSASLQSPQFCFFLLSIALVALASLF